MAPAWQKPGERSATAAQPQAGQPLGPAAADGRAAAAGFGRSSADLACALAAAKVRRQGATAALQPRPAPAPQQAAAAAAAAAAAPVPKQAGALGNFSTTTCPAAEPALPMHLSTAAMPRPPVVMRHERQQAQLQRQQLSSITHAATLLAPQHSAARRQPLPVSADVARTAQKSAHSTGIFAAAATGPALVVQSPTGPAPTSLAVAGQHSTADLVARMMACKCQHAGARTAASLPAASPAMAETPQGDAQPQTKAAPHSLHQQPMPSQQPGSTSGSPRQPEVAPQKRSTQLQSERVSSTASGRQSASCSRRVSSSDAASYAPSAAGSGCSLHSCAAAAGNTGAAFGSGGARSSRLPHAGEGTCATTRLACVPRHGARCRGSLHSSRCWRADDGSGRRAFRFAPGLHPSTELCNSGSDICDAGS